MVVSVTVLISDHLSGYGFLMKVDALIEKLKVLTAVVLFFWAGWTGGSPQLLMAAMAAFYLGYRMQKDVGSKK